MSSRSLLVAHRESEPTIVWSRSGDELGFFWLLTPPERLTQALGAVKLFELGHLAAGRAAELAGISRVEFLLSLEINQVFPLAAELADLEAEYA